MIARFWHGVTNESRADEYLDYLRETGIADFKVCEGYRGVFVMRRVEDDRAHFLLMSLWDSLDSVKRFAGDNVEQARYYPADRDYLLELEPHVQHYEVVEDPWRKDIYVTDSEIR
jgi:heme-degrading monooxygenase HmoA